MASYRAFYLTGPRQSWQDRVKIALAALIGLGILFGALVVSLSIALILVPILAVGYLFRRQILRAALRSLEKRAPGRPDMRRPGSPSFSVDETIIDAEYRVVPPNERRP